MQKWLLKSPTNGIIQLNPCFTMGLSCMPWPFTVRNDLPFPKHVVITAASESDLNVFKQDWSNIPDRTFYGDKIYNDAEFFKDLAININSIMLTPVKGVKGQPDIIKRRDKAANKTQI
jgi:hypothetical protein